MRQVIELVFAKFDELGSCYQVLRYCKQQQILLPRRQTNDPNQGELLWKKPSAPAIRAIITNPAYAGAFVYGRRPSDPARRRPGRPATGTVRKPMAQWQCILHELYPAYISWEQYLTNQARLNDNACRYTDNGLGRGTAREGAALLQGLATCGCCGHVMRVAYRPRARYICEGMTRLFAEPRCLHLEGPPIEAFVVKAFFEALQPVQLAALDDVLAQRQRDYARLEQYHQQQVQRAHYEANLAKRRYQQVDPANRLVAQELETDWNDKLRALRDAKEVAERFAQQPAQPQLTPELRAQLLNLSQALPELWASNRLTNEQRKELLRSLIARVILKRPTPDRVAVKIVWVSGHFSEGMVIPPIHRQADVSGYEVLVTRIEQLWRAGYTDAQIAETLSVEGFRSARSPHVPQATVLKIRNRHQWVSHYHQHRLAEKIDGMWTIHGLAQQLKVDRDWFYTRIKSGFLSEPDVIRKPPYGNYLIRNDAKLIARLHREIQRTRPSNANLKPKRASL